MRARPKLLSSPNPYIQSFNIYSFNHPHSSHAAHHKLTARMARHDLALHIASSKESITIIHHRGICIHHAFITHHYPLTFTFTIQMQSTAIMPYHQPRAIAATSHLRARGRFPLGLPLPYPGRFPPGLPQPYLAPWQIPTGIAPTTSQQIPSGIAPATYEAISLIRDHLPCEAISRIRDNLLFQR
jgi:hypothetical protein